MKKFLYLDNWHEPQTLTRFDRYLAETGMNIDVIRTNDGDVTLEPADYCGAFVSPSFDGAYDDLPWIHRLHDLLANLGAAGVPMLGLCFGSQILASALVGRDQVFIREEREKGFGTIRLTADGQNDQLADSLPVEMPVFHWHGDEVRSGHEDIIVLADSDGCSNQFWRWSRGPVWGVQPHPEFDREGLLQWFSDNRAEFETGGLDHASLIGQAHDSLDAFGILRNFLARIESTSAS